MQIITLFFFLSLLNYHTFFFIFFSTQIPATEDEFDKPVSYEIVEIAED